MDMDIATIHLQYNVFTKATASGTNKGLKCSIKGLMVSSKADLKFLICVMTKY